MNLIEEYHEAVAYVDSFSNISFRNNSGKAKKDPRFFLDRTAYFLRLLGNPEKGFSYIHVTGTAGKGTVSAMLQEVLIASGKKTGLFTSPYVTTATEKIRVNDKYISPEDLIRLVEYLRPFIAKAEKGTYGAPSSFELFFVMAILYFKEQKCEWVVLEVGLGGCYDATNVIEKPVVTTITNIDYDHTDILGTTLREIAIDKAGIIKKGSSFFTSEQRPQIQSMFKKTCNAVGVSFYAIPHQANYSDYNVELVKSIAGHLKISKADAEEGIKRMRLPCRFEIMDKKPLIVLDGAHNRAKIRSTIHNISKHHFSELYLVVAIADLKKDHKAILQPLLELPYKTHLIFTQIRSGERKSISAKRLFELATKYKAKHSRKDAKHPKNTKLEVLEDPHEALEKAVQMANKDDMILVTGSFFLAGLLREKWFSEERVLKNRTSFPK